MSITTTLVDDAYYDVSSLISVGDFIYTCSPAHGEIIKTDLSVDNTFNISERSGILDSPPHEVLESNGLLFALTEEGLYGFREKLTNQIRKLLFDKVDLVMGVIDGYIVVCADRTLYLVDATGLTIKAERYIAQPTDVLAIIGNNIYSIRRDGVYVILDWDNVSDELTYVDNGRFDGVKNAKRATVYTDTIAPNDSVLQLVMQNYGVSTFDVNNPLSPVLINIDRYDDPKHILNIDDDNVFVASTNYLDDYQVTFPVNWARSISVINGINLVIGHSPNGRLTFTSEHGLNLPQTLLLYDADNVDKTSWTITVGDLVEDSFNRYVGDRGLTIYDNTLYAHGGAFALSVAYRDLIDLIPGMGFTLSAWLGGFEDQFDNAQVTIEWREADDTPISTFTIGPVTRGDRGLITIFLFRSVTDVIPPLAVKARVTMTITRLNFVNNDGYVDAVILDVF